MSFAQNYEARLESAKMLIDLFHQKHHQLQLPEVVKASIKSLEKLLDEREFPEIRQFAIMALSSMMDVSDDYKTAIVQSDLLLAVVVKTVVDKPKDPNMSYDTIQVRRECSKVLSRLALHNALELSKRLLVVTNIQNWKNELQNLEDSRLIVQRDVLLSELLKAEALCA